MGGVLSALFEGLARLVRWRRSHSARVVPSKVRLVRFGGAAVDNEQRFDAWECWDLGKAKAH